MELQAALGTGAYTNRLERLKMSPSRGCSFGAPVLATVGVACGLVATAGIPASRSAIRPSPLRGA